MKNPSSPSRPDHIQSTPGRFGLRTAIFLVLAGIAAGVSLDRYFTDKEGGCSAKAPEISNTTQSQADQLKEKDGSWPSNLVSEICFDKNPLSYVDVDQCRELLFQMTGDPNCKQLTVDEMRQEIHKAETEERMFKAEALIDKYCISNPVDQDMIRDAALQGCVGVDEDTIYQSQDGQWYINLTDEFGEYCEAGNTELSEEPPCREPLTDEKKAEKEELKAQHDRMKSMVEALKNNEKVNALDDVDIKRLEEDILSEGLEEHDLVDLLKEAKRKMAGDMDSMERKKLGCKLMSLAMNKEVSELKEEEPESIAESGSGPEENAVVSEAYEAMEELAIAILKAENVDDAEECFLYLYDLEPPQ